jgi:hypothetical protein
MQILPTYPCSKPSDSMGLRTSLAKYIDSVRMRSLQGLGSNSGTSSRAKTGVTTREAQRGTASVAANNTISASSVSIAAYWWKDVVVRKSLLDECSGERCVLRLKSSGFAYA